MLSDVRICACKEIGVRSAATKKILIVFVKFIKCKSISVRLAMLTYVTQCNNI